MSEQQLAGNGVVLVRERALARAVQQALERMYQIEDGPDVHAFVAPADEGERESLHLRRGEDGVLEVSLRLPSLTPGLDALCQLIEGVSHFVYVAERARVELEATQLELELQAEVDKYVVLLAAGELDSDDAALARSASLRARLYERVRFYHAAGSERGERYRVANATAAQFALRLEREFIAAGRLVQMRDELRRFFRMGQEGKLRAARMT